MPTVYKAMPVKRSRNSAADEQPWYTWRCQCGKQMKTQCRAIWIACGACKKYMNCVQKAGVISE
jgi:hypothetical protein